jgi:hypothetical protein
MPRKTRAVAETAPLSMTREKQEETLRHLKIPPAVYADLWEWGITPEMLQPVVRFLERVRSWRRDQEARITVGRQVHGRGRDPHHDLHLAESGELEALNQAVDEVGCAIRQAISLHKESSDAIYDHRIASAWPHMEAVLRALTENEVEVDPDLPGRTRGRKPEMMFPLQEDDLPRRVRRRDLERALKALLLPLHPDHNRVVVKMLAANLLDSILRK